MWKFLGEHSNIILPIFTAFITGLITYFFTRKSNQEKNYPELAMTSIDSILGKMYIEVIDIVNVYNCDQKRIRKFIMKYGHSNEIHRINDSRVLGSLLKLSIEIKNNSIEDDELKKQFEFLSESIENLYWNTLKGGMQDFIWWRVSKAHNNFSSILFNLYIVFEHIIERTLAILGVICVYIIADKIVNSTENRVVNAEISSQIFMIFIFLLVLWGCVAAFKDMKGNKLVKREKIIKKKLRQK